MTGPTISVADKYYNKGVRFYSQGDHKKARICWMKAVEEDGGHYRALTFLGVMSENEGAIDDAIGFYQQALEANPDYPTVHNNLGNAYRNMGRAEDAIRHYRRAVELTPFDGSCHFNLARTLFDVRDYASAELAYRKAIVFNHEDAEAQLELGETYYCTEQRGKALEHFRIYIALRPLAPNALQVQARIQFLLQEDEA